jgi:hypothetical protein
MESPDDPILPPFDNVGTGVMLIADEPARCAAIQAMKLDQEHCQEKKNDIRGQPGRVLPGHNTTKQSHENDPDQYCKEWVNDEPLIFVRRIDAIPIWPSRLGVEIVIEDSPPRIHDSSFASQ